MEVDTLLPRVSPHMATTAAILNIFLPGWGTMLASAYSDSPDKTPQFLCGILQLATAWWIVGWAWSIFWSYLLFRGANLHTRKQGEVDRLLEELDETIRDHARKHYKKKHSH